MKMPDMDMMTNIIKIYPLVRALPFRKNNNRYLFIKLGPYKCQLLNYLYTQNNNKNVYINLQVLSILIKKESK